MSTMFFLNLPVKDLDAATKFYRELGYQQNLQFSDENASSIVISDTIVVMLLTRPFFESFTSRTVSDPAEVISGLYCLSADSRAEVDNLTEKAIAAGGSSAGDPQDHGFMYGRSFHDLDGHHWEVMWMDPSHVE